MGHGEPALNGALRGVFEVEVNEAWLDPICSALLHEVEGSQILDEEVLM